MDFKTILKEQFKDLITEETLTAVHEAFEQAVTEKAELQTEAAILKLDEDHSNKLQTLVEAIDEDHTNKLQKLVETIDFDHTNKLKSVVEKIDTDYTSKLQIVIDKYKTMLNEEAKSYQEQLVSEISNYLDLYLDKVTPKDQISEAVQNIQSKKIVDQIRLLVGINEEFVDGEVKEALVDGKRTIDSLKKELNEAIEANTELNHKLQKIEAIALLEEKTKELPANAKSFVGKLLKNKSPEYIQENYQYVVEMFEKESVDEIEAAQEEITTRIVESVDRPEVAEVVEESLTSPVAQPAVGGYLNEMKRLDGSKLKFKH
jgi:hypothetical protein